MTTPGAAAVPASAPAEEQPIFRARVAAPIAPMHEEPRVASQQVSQQLAGHEVDAMDVEGEWVRARGADGYEGWMHLGFLERTLDGPPVVPRISLGCVAERPDRCRRSLPLRALLAPDEMVVDGSVIGGEVRAKHFPLEPDAIVHSALERFRGTSYVWGGVTPWGADCSGLVQAVFALHGRILPRDAWQQAELGIPVAGLDALDPGDLLFFSDRPDQRVTHVGIAVRRGEMVHLALGRGGYAHEQLDSCEHYVARLRERFLFARRLLSS